LPISPVGRLRFSCGRQRTSFVSSLGQSLHSLLARSSLLPIAPVGLLRYAPGQRSKACRVLRFVFHRLCRTPKVPRKFREVDWSADPVLFSTVEQHQPRLSLKFTPRVIVSARSRSLNVIAILCQPRYIGAVKRNQAVLATLRTGRDSVRKFLRQKTAPQSCTHLTQAYFDSVQA
jgi:hypothetical protein